jgi:shikimate 5-dehydrogenase
MGRQFTFIGVTTTKSSIMQIFPRWRDLLRLGDDVEVVGWDLPIHAPAEQYRAAVQRLKEDPHNLGALVTTHKLDLFQASRDLIDEADRYAKLCHEASCLAKREGRLLAWAMDPISAGRSLDDILGSGYFAKSGGHVLCFGAGGSGVAISLHLMSRPLAADRPPRIVVTNRSAGRLTTLQALHSQIDSDVAVEYVQSADPRTNDQLVAALPPGSLVINATGMGKDTPGSPVTDDARFPEQGIAWEINYRGELPFLYQAWSQRQSRGVHVEDGWQYFIYGWTCVMEEVFDRRISPAELVELSRAAAFARPALPTNALAGPTA